MSPSLSHLSRCERGAASVEFAMVGLMAIILFLGILEFGRGLYMRHEMSYAMDLGVRRILTNPTIANAAVETIIREAFGAGPVGSLLITFGTLTVDGVEFRTILATYPVTLLIPGLANRNITLKIDRIIPLGSG